MKRAFARWVSLEANRPRIRTSYRLCKKQMIWASHEL